jgi:hypothetical protein
MSDGGRVESRFNPFADSVSVSAKIGAWVAPNILSAQVEARFGPFGDSATLDASLVHGLRQTYRRLRNSIGGTRWNSWVT